MTKTVALTETEIQSLERTLARYDAAVEEARRSYDAKPYDRHAYAAASEELRMAQADLDRTARHSAAELIAAARRDLDARKYRDVVGRPWFNIKLAPRDGTIIEIHNTYGGQDRVEHCKWDGEFVGWLVMKQRFERLLEHFLDGPFLRWRPTYEAAKVEAPVTAGFDALRIVDRPCDIAGPRKVCFASSDEDCQKLNGKKVLEQLGKIQETMNVLVRRSLER